MVVLMVLGLCSCKSGISVKQAKAETKQLCTYFTEENWEAASGMFHPSAKADADTVKAAFGGLGSKFELKSTTGFKKSYNETKIGGSLCQISAKVLIDDQEYTAVFQLVNNDDGYGFTYVKIDVDNKKSDPQNQQA